MTQAKSPDIDDSMPTHRDRHADIGGARLRYRDDGRGPAVIFLHGWTLDLDMWEPQALALRDNYRVVRYDRRGFGGSGGRPAPAGDAADLAALCDALGVERFALLGMSQGARTALAAAAAMPQRIWALALDGAPPLVAHAQGAAPSAAPSRAPEPAEIPLADYRALVKAHGLAAFRERWSRHPFATLRSNDAATLARLSAMLAHYPGHDLIDADAPAAPPITAALLAKLTCPALVISGAHDLATRRRAADELAHLLPRARRIEIAGAGHLCNLDAPSTYAAALRELLDAHAPQPATERSS